nr:hypothetical protein [Tanacetum cinerariifolium]
QTPDSGISNLLAVGTTFTSSGNLYCQWECLTHFIPNRLQIHQSPRGIFINQAKYALEILHKHGMEKVKALGSSFDLTTFSNADHAGCIDTRKSTSRGIQFLGDKLVSWMSKKQNCTAMSSAEAEYVALSTSCAQVMWMRIQLQDYGFNYNKIPLYCDSQSAIAISCNPVQHSAGGKDRLPMLAPGNYVQWRSRIKRYIDTKPNHELIHYCLKNPLYKFTWADKEVPVTKGSSVTTKRYMENYKNVSQDIRDQLNAKAKVVQIILIGIDNDIYSTFDACPITCEMWKAIERLKQGELINVQDLETSLYWEFRKFTSRDGESLKSYYSRFYKMVNELVRNQCDVTNHQVNVQANQDNSPRISKGTGYDNQRKGNVDGARETVGKKMLLCKQEEAGFQLNVEQADWRDDTDDEPEDQELEAHYIEQLDQDDDYDDLANEEMKKELFAHQETISILSQVKESQNKLYKTYDDKELDKVIALENKVKSAERYFSERSNMCHTHVNNENSKESFNKQTTLLEKRMDESIPYDQKCKISKELFKIKRSVVMIFNGVEHFKETIAKRTYFGHIDPFIQNTIEANFCLEIRRINADLEKFHLCLKEEMVADLRYFNSLELEVDSLKSQLETQKTQFLIEIDRLSREYYYAYHMNAILGVYTELDEVTNLQCEYLELLEKCECLEKALSKSKIILNAKTSNVNFVCVTCGNCVLNEKHDMCVLNSRNGVNSRTKMPMVVPVSTREPKRIIKQSVAKPLRKTVASESINQKPRHTTRKLYEHVSKACSWWYPKFIPPGYKWKPKSQIGNVKPNLVEIILFIIYSRCSKHMTGNLKLLTNFVEKFLGTVKFYNDQIAQILGYGDLVQGAVTIKRVYYVEGLNHNLFSVGQFCDTDLEVAFRKSKCYIRDLKGNDLLIGTEFLNKTLHAYFASEGILHQTSVARTPEQNGVVERQNCTLVEDARTMLSAAKVPVFIWAEAITTTCFTQNCSLVIPRHEKTPYHIINDRKPSVKFFHIFGSLCYIARDGENLDKMKEKGDACIFVGYSTQSRAYRVFNKRTRVIVETIHVNFDELRQMALDHVSSDPVPQCERTTLEHDSLSPSPHCQENVPHVARTVTTSNKLDLLFSSMFNELLNGSSQVVSKSSAETTSDAPNQRQQQNTTPLNTQTTPDPSCHVPTQASTVTSTENINQVETIEKMHKLKMTDLSTSFVHRYKTEGRHPRTRRQLESDGEMCMFTLTVSRTEPKNIKEAMADSAWIQSMQEELHQFDRLDIHQSPRGIFVNQAKYSQEILIKQGMTSCDSIGTLMAAKHLDADLSGTSVDQTKYRSMVGALVYLTTSRPDIVHAICYCARYQVNPTEKHLTAIKRIFRLDSRERTSGGIQFLGGDKLVSSSSKKQDCTSMSLAEAEYVSLSACCAKVLWMRTQLTDYDFHFDKIPMCCNSKAAIAISCNPFQHSRTKHIDVRYHFIKEKVEKGIVELFFVETEYQLADLFSKALPEDRFKYLVRRLGMRCLTPEELKVAASSILRLLKPKVHKSSVEPRRDPIINLLRTQSMYNTCCSSINNICEDGNPARANIKQALGSIRRSYALSWKPCQGDSLNLPDHRMVVVVYLFSAAGMGRE